MKELNMKIHWHGWGNHTQLVESMQETLGLTSDEFASLVFNKVMLLQYAKVVDDKSVLINHVTQIERVEIEGKEVEFRFYMLTPDGKVNLGAVKKSNIKPLKY